MRIERRFTKAGQGAYADIEFRKATSEIKNPDGSVVFRLENIDVPAQFSQVATDVLAQKYFRKAGVPTRLKKIEENDVPSFLWRSVPDDAALKNLPKDEQTGSEIDARQVFDRLAGTWTYWGWKGGYFSSEEDASAFKDELAYMLATQRVAPNSPQWFNTGLHWAYGIDGPGQGHFYVDPFTGKLTKSKSAYEHPQPHGRSASVPIYSGFAPARLYANLRFPQPDVAFQRSGLVQPDQPSRSHQGRRTSVRQVALDLEGRTTWSDATQDASYCFEWHALRL